MNSLPGTCSWTHRMARQGTMLLLPP